MFLLGRFCQPLITFCLFAVISVLFQLLGHSSLHLMLPLLCVFGVGGEWVRPQSDDNASHVITASPISRCVRGQTVVQQLSKEHAELQKYAKWLQETTNVGNLDTIHFLWFDKYDLFYSEETDWMGYTKQVYSIYTVNIIIKMWRVSPLLWWMRVISHGHFH